MLTIDGSEGEGGGQVLRTSLGLSCITGKSFRMINIRKNRKKPGLMPQHLTGVKAMQEITRSSVQGDSLGSMELSFRPGRTSPGKYLFDIHTAGSVTLLLQTLLPPLLLADDHSILTLRGGTHVPFSPPYEYIHEVFFPMLRRAGITVDTTIEHYGFYPRGGGQIQAAINPVKEIIPIQCEHPDVSPGISGTSGVARLPLSIAERQKRSALQCLEGRDHEASIRTLAVPSPAPGTFLFLKMEGNGYTAGFSSLGERGKRAEAVGRESCLKLLSHVKTGRCLDPHLSDQIVLYLALARGRSVFSTSRITKHLSTNLDMISRFIDISWSIDGKEGTAGTVTIETK